PRVDRESEIEGELDRGRQDGAQEAIAFSGLDHELPAPREQTERGPVHQEIDAQPDLTDVEARSLCLPDAQRGSVPFAFLRKAEFEMARGATAELEPVRALVPADEHRERARRTGFDFELGAIDGGLEAPPASDGHEKTGTAVLFRDAEERQRDLGRQVADL